MSGVTLKDIMAQLQRMDARLDTFTDELCQVNTRVGCIDRRQAEMGGYTMPSTLMALTEESDADDADDSDDEATASDEDDGDDEMST